MRRFFLTIIVLLFLFSPVILYAQMNSIDRFKMQQQAEQFTNRMQTSSQSTMLKSQEAAQKNKVEARLQEQRSEEINAAFAKAAKKSQKSYLGTMLQMYLIPLCMLVIAGAIFYIVWHNKILPK